MDPPPDEPPGLAFRDEILPWLFGDDGSEEDDDEEDVVDESGLFGDSEIDTGVTSGSDPTLWDSIEVDESD